MSDGLNEQFGLPDWKLTLCLALAWAIVFVILIKGVKSAGKVSPLQKNTPFMECNPEPQTK